MQDDIYEDSLKYHVLGNRPGKTEVVPTKPCATQRDLSLAYSPGVAEPCRRIAAEVGDVYRYTNKGNLVAVVTAGTAVLGLGDLGPAAAKPVMEGKAVLFRRFAGIDVFDIEVNTKDPDAFIATVESIAPTFGGINLEDIAGRHCFYIEQELSKRLDIPVFHDDQHGTAIIAAAALINACEVTGRKIADVRCAFNGAGAAGISVGRLFIRLGVRRENITMCDSKGVIYDGRPGKLDANKAEFAARTDARTLADAMRGADCFIGLSVGNVVTPEMLSTMAKDPMVFAMANPTPEIDYNLAVETRPDVIMATGRSDFPNQVNNVLGFPFIFRGALDTHARGINEEMKLAAVHSLAELAKEAVPQSVSHAYNGDQFEFGRDYLIPKPFDPRVLYYVSVAVAEAAMQTGMARKTLDIDAYRESLRQQADAGRSLVSVPVARARGKEVRIAIPEAHLPKIASVARHAIQDGTARPVLVGNEELIREAMGDANKADYDIVDPTHAEHLDELVAVMQRLRPLDDLDETECCLRLTDPYVFSTILTEAGLCEGMLAAGDRPYGEMVRPIVTYGSRRHNVSRIAGMHLMALRDRQLFFADTALIPDPSAEELAEIAMRTARFVGRLNLVPRVAFVSFENFSRRDDVDISKLRRAFKIVRQTVPDLEVVGDVQADVALEPERFRSVLGKRVPEAPANVLIFPNLHAANAAFRLARVIGGGSAIGPFLLGLKRPCNVLPGGSTEDEIAKMLVITAYNARRRKEEIEGGAPSVLP